MCEFNCSVPLGKYDPFLHAAYNYSVQQNEQGLKEPDEYTQLLLPRLLTVSALCGSAVIQYSEGISARGVCVYLYGLLPQNVVVANQPQSLPAVTVVEPGIRPRPTVLIFSIVLTILCGIHGCIPLFLCLTPGLVFAIVVKLFSYIATISL